MYKLEEVYKQMISQTRLTPSPNAHDLTLVGTINFKPVNGENVPFLTMGDNDIRVHLQSDTGWSEEPLQKYNGKIITVKCYIDYNIIIIKEIINYQY